MLVPRRVIIFKKTLYATGFFCIYKVKSEKAYQTNQNTSSEFWSTNTELFISWVYISSFGSLELRGSLELIGSFVLQHLDCWQCFIAILLKKKNITNPQLAWFTLCKSPTFLNHVTLSFQQLTQHNERMANMASTNIRFCGPASFRYFVHLFQYVGVWSSSERIVLPGSTLDLDTSSWFSQPNDQQIISNHRRFSGEWARSPWQRFWFNGDIP